jgi:hypothetical protein
MEIWILVVTYFFLGIVVLGLEAVLAPNARDRTIVAVWGGIGLVAAVLAELELSAGFLPVAAYLLSLPAFWVPLRYMSERQVKAVNSPERQIPARSKELCAAVSDAVRHAPISPEQKSSIQSQVADVPQNIKASMEKLRRLQKLQDLNIRLKGGNDPQLAEMETDLLHAMNAALELLLSIPKSLMMVEVARDERAVARILSALGETNQRMLDLAQAQAEIGHPFDAQTSTDPIDGATKQKSQKGSSG